MSTATDFMVIATAIQQRTAQLRQPKPGRAAHTDLSVNGTCAMEHCHNTAEHECDSCHKRFCGNCSTGTRNGGRMCNTCLAEAAD